LIFGCDFGEFEREIDFLDCLFVCSVEEVGFKEGFSFAGGLILGSPMLVE
jgi:hypothetical protein